MAFITSFFYLWVEICGLNTRVRVLVLTKELLRKANCEVFPYKHKSEEQNHSCSSLKLLMATCQFNYGLLL